MKTLKTAKGLYTYRNDGSPETFQPLEECQIETSAGHYTPAYMVEDHGRKKLSPVKFHKNGMIKTIALQRAQTVRTSVGNFEAELLTFYPDGSLHRLFPLNGKVSGYWSENDEYKLAETLTIPTYWGILAVKPINIEFYKTGLLKSLTLWPGERSTLETPSGEILIRKGVSFYKDGSLHSCEPAVPAEVRTSIGKIWAYDSDINGLDGSRNSLVFTESGEVEALTTTRNEVTLMDDWGFRSTFTPERKSSLCGENSYRIEPLRISFDENMVTFRKGTRTAGKVHLRSRFTVNPYIPGIPAETPDLCSEAG
ncbi:hypothetical protein [Spirochaeta isovalerica]|uniref:MORN repeat protein n=1 Tax=Spirochaeta isovalerica TaxID=150 RepID=A0A841R8M5_9SPIO|nr:hypothetical protein [Spirochaeta isovalerica]MBB6480156.1 hypothetical protein [Spirochaeta isovalerica]